MALAISLWEAVEAWFAEEVGVEADERAASMSKKSVPRSWPE